jgi:gluconolactonase
MRTTTSFQVAFIALLASGPLTVAQSQTTRIDTVVVGSTVGIPGVVADSTDIVRILEGFNGLDDPIGLSDGSLLFSEPDGLRIHSLDTATGEVSVLVAESNESHGITEDATGRLISAQAWDGSTRIGVIYPPEQVETLADEYRGEPFSRPNDLIVAKSGSVYFTDPGLTSGQEQELIERYNGRPLAPRLPPTVYHIPPGGEAVAIDGDMIRPNGIQLSRDERTLYIADSNGAHLIAWDIRDDGNVTNRREFGTLHGRSPRNNGLGGVRTYGDGMAVDADDRIYVATGMGIEVLSADGENLGSIPVRCVPRDCQNVAFGGPDKRTLYVAGAGSLYSIEMLARGLPERAK